jgi:hypothetical protein
VARTHLALLVKWVHAALNTSTSSLCAHLGCRFRLRVYGCAREISLAAAGGARYCTQQRLQCRNTVIAVSWGWVRCNKRRLRRCAADAFTGSGVARRAY